MALVQGDLVLCSGTLPADVAFDVRCQAARAGGFQGVSLWGRDYWSAREEGSSDADLRAILSDHGLAVAELDPAWWWLPGAHDIGRSIPAAVDRQRVFCYGEPELFAIADALGARSINAVDVFGGAWSPEEAAEAFAGLCDRAAEHGLLVHLEFLPWSRIPGPAAAWEIVRLADRSNGGIAVDAWHYFRSGADAVSLRAVPGDRIVGIQLNDGPLASEDNLVSASLHARTVPGDGELDLASLMTILHQIGAVAPLGVEAFSDVLHDLGALEAARRAGAAVRRLLAQVS